MKKSEIERFAKIEKKERKKDYEAGSGSLYIPILGDLFPKLFGQEMKEIEVYSLIIDGSKYSVGKEIFDKVNEEGEAKLYYDKTGNTVIEVEVKIEEQWVPL